MPIVAKLQFHVFLIINVCVFIELRMSNNFSLGTKMANKVQLYLFLLDNLESEQP